jgi:hypothetical protein
MKKQVKKITLKTDKIVNLSTRQALNVLGGRRADSAAQDSCKNDKTIPTCL